MIPLRDSVSSKRWPLITLLLIAINGYVFVKELFLGPGIKEFICQYAVIPVNYLNPQGENYFYGLIRNNLTLITALFLHGGWVHLIGNMWYLWIFGDNVEDKFGHLNFLIFYLLCGIAGNLAHIFMNPTSAVPGLGASGCIAGVLGAYYLIFPRSRIVTLVPIIFFFTVVEVPAFFFLGIWFIIQFLNGFLVLPYQREVTGVAWWAHVGGFMSGLLLGPVFATIPGKRKSAKARKR